VLKVDWEQGGPWIVQVSSNAWPPDRFHDLGDSENEDWYLSVLGERVMVGRH
jgi:hypothetical protein